MEFDDKSRKASPIGTPPQPNNAENAHAGKITLGKRSSPSGGHSGERGQKRLVGAGCIYRGYPFRMRLTPDLI